MAPTGSPKTRQRGLERVRDQILTALHFGKLRPGDRAPSVRRLAGLTGMNRKTVHRAYRSLAREGLLDLRPGSGTFISEQGSTNGEPAAGELIRAINRCRAEAARLGVPPKVFSDFLNNYLGDGLRGIPLAVVECNEEQIGLIGHDLERGLGVQARWVSLEKVTSKPKEVLAESWGVVTTDCHWSEVAGVVRPTEWPLYRVALDASFPQVLAHQAKAGPVIMVVQDRRFEPVFLKLLSQISVPEQLLRRFTFVEPAEARAVLARSEHAATVHVSPLVADQLDVPPHFRRLDTRWHVVAGSVDRLRARLALDAALRRSQAA